MTNCWIKYADMSEMSSPGGLVAGLAAGLAAGWDAQFKIRISNCVWSRTSPVEAQALQVLMATLAFLELSTLHDLDCLNGLVTTTLGHVLDLVDNVVALQHFAENNVATIEP